MNSIELQKDFPKIYQNFFSNNPVVLSGCVSIAWFPTGLGTGLNNFSIKSKIPLKMYVGFKKIKHKELKIKEVISYDVVNKDFKLDDFKKISKKYTEIKKFIDNFLDESNLKNGYEINILCEVSRSHGFGFSGTLSSIISVGLSLLTKRIKTDDLLDYDRFMESKNFDYIYLFALNLVRVSKHNNTSGSTVISTLKNNASPSLLVCEKKKNDEKYDDKFNLRYKYFDILKDLSKDNIVGEIPLDFCMIYSGLPSKAIDVISGSKSDIKRYNVYENFLDDLLKNLGNINTDLENFCKKDSIYKHIRDTNKILSLKLLKSFIDLYEYGDNNNLSDIFIDTINNFSSNLSLIEKPCTFSDDFKKAFEKNIYKSDKIGIFPIYSGKIGGGYLLVSKQYKDRDSILETIKEIKKTYHNANLEYISWEDGYTSDPIKVEQYISKNIFSKNFSRNSFLLKSNSGKEIIGEFFELIDKVDNGIIVDTIKNKVYINGEKLTSKEMHSQSTTVELFVKLMDNFGNEISNLELSKSSYTKNKNEMIGKIILPIKKLTKNIFNKEIDLICKGGITNFKLSILEEDIEIGIIRKI